MSQAGRVLVTGARGFVGQPVSMGLARSGLEVHGLYTDPWPPGLPGVCWHRLDLSDRGAVTRLMKELRPEKMIHLAWYTEHGRVWNAPENVAWVEYSLHLMRAFAHFGGRRLVMLGSCAEYDWSAVVGPCIERCAPIVPRTLYGVSKDALRRVAAAYAKQEGIELAWGRPFLIYGPRESPGRLVPSVVRSLLAGHSIATGSTGRVRDYMYVEDVAGAVVALLNCPVVGVVNIASGVGVSLGEVIDMIVSLLGHPGLVRRGTLPDPRGEPATLLADIARLRDEVGYTPRWSLAEGMAATVRWWEEKDTRQVGRR
jgi:nucleoside-diphosphate-sugar epimerase